MKNNVPLVIAIFVMACVFRGACEVSELDIVIIMAFINALSLMFVIYFLVHSIDTYVSDKINSFSVDSSKKEKSVKKVRIVLNIITVITLTVFGVVYILFHNTLSNDIISIIALGISIITTEIGKSIGGIIVEKIKDKLL